MLLTDVLRETDRRDSSGRRITFRLKWVQYDRSRKRGGQLRDEDNLERCGASHDLRKTRQISVRKADGTGHPVPVFIRGIVRFNKQAVHQ